MSWRVRVILPIRHSVSVCGCFPRCARWELCAPHVTLLFRPRLCTERDKNNTNRPLLVELFRVGASVVDPSRPRKVKLTDGKSKHRGAERLYALGRVPCVFRVC